MNHYPHHIGDYAKDTMGLSQGEHGAYRLLMDSYYATEAPLPNDMDELYAIARATNPAERRCVDRVLKKYFTLASDGYHKGRIDEEIVAYRERADTARQNGKSGGRKRNPEKTQSVSSGFSSGSVVGSQNTTQNETNPIANISEPIGSGGKPPGRDWLFSVGLGMLTEAGQSEKQARSIVGMWCSKHGDDATLQAMQDVAARRPADPIAAVQAKLTGKSAKNGAALARGWANELLGGDDGRVIESTAVEVR